MAVSISDTDIANNGLLLIGAKTITSLTQGNKSANTMNALYIPTRRQLLSYPWNFASFREKLARSSVTPDFEYNYAYVLPDDWLYTVSVHDNDAGAGSIVYKHEQVDNANVLLANEEDVYIRYIKDVTDPNLWTADFQKAMSSALARDAAIAISNSNKLQQAMEVRARRDLNKAQSSDAQGSFPERRPRGSWANSRNGLHSRGGFGGI